MQGTPFADGAVEFGAIAVELKIFLANPDEDLLEQRGQEVAAYVVVDAGVEACRILQQIDEREGLVRAALDPLYGLGQPLGHCSPFERDGFEPLAQLRRLDRPFGGKVDEPRLLVLKALELLAELFLLLLIDLLRLGQRLSHCVSDALKSVGQQLLPRDYPRHSILDIRDAGVLHGAAAVAELRRADVVLVGAAVACVHGVHQAAHPALFVAVSTVDQAAQEVKVVAVAVAASVTLTQD